MNMDDFERGYEAGFAEGRKSLRQDNKKEPSPWTVPSVTLVFALVVVIIGVVLSIAFWQTQ